MIQRLLFASPYRIPTYSGQAFVVGKTEASGAAIVIRLNQVSEDMDGECYRCPDGTEYDVTAQKIRAGGTENVAVRIENIVTRLSERRKGVIETDLLSGKSVLIVGLGTGGATVALELAKSGVGKFALVDPDRLEIGNVARHSAGVSFVGRKKVKAVRDLILESSPIAGVETFDLEANHQNKEILEGLVKDTDLVICATDNRPSKLFVNGLCVAAKKPVIFGGAFRRAYGGRVVRVRPGESACYHCFVMTSPDSEADREISTPAAAESIAYADRPVAVEPGLSMDVAPISIMVSKLALQELIREEESTLHILDDDLEAGIYIWANRPEPGSEFASSPPLSRSYDERTILRWYGIYFDRDPDCPTCGDFEKYMIDHYRIEIEGGSLSDLPSPDKN